MPQPSGNKQGIRQTQSRRVGIDLGRLKGMNRHADPGAIGEDEFWDLINVRLGGDGISSRPGLSEINTNAMPGCVYSIWDDRNPNDDGNAIFNVNRLGYGPQVWNDVYPASLGDFRIRGTLNGQTVIIDDSGSAIAFSYVTTDGVPEFSQTPVFTYDSDLVNAAVRSAVEFDGALWFLYSTSDTSKAEIWKWTGGDEAVLEETVSGITSIYANLATDGTEIYLALEDSIRKRNGGDWDELTMPGGAGTGWLPVGWYGLARPPYVYFAGYDSDVDEELRVMIILQVIGETVTVASNTVPTWDSVEEINNYGTLAELGGYLYIVGNTTQGAQTFSLFQITGAASVTSIVNLSSQLTLASNGNENWHQLVAWRNQLFISCPRGDSNATFARSDIGNVLVWTQIAIDGDTGSTGDAFPLFTA